MLVGRKRRKDLLLPKGVYRHGGRYRIRVYVGKDRKPAWHVFKATTPGALFAEHGRFMGNDSRLTLDTVFTRYLKNETPKKADATQKSDTAAMKHLAAALGDMAPGKVKAHHVAAYIDQRGKTAPVRANRERALLGHVFTKCRHWGIIDQNPAAALYYRNPEYPRDRYVTDAELWRASRLASPLIRYVMWLVALTGLRRSDVLSLRWGDFSDEGLTVTLSKSKRRGGTKKTLQFSWSASLRKLYARMALHSKYNPEPGSPVFPAENQRYGVRYVSAVSRINESTFDCQWAAFQRSVERAGIERFQLRDLRAKHATDTDAAGGDAQRHLAHSSSATTRRHYQRRPVKIDLDQ